MLLGKACGIHKFCWVLVFIGAINWGLVGAFQYNLVESLLGAWDGVVRIVYILVGLAGLCMLAYPKCCGCNCSSNTCDHCHKK
jgi:uncharacterized protein